MSVFKWLTPEGRIYQAMRRLVLLPWLLIILGIVQIIVWSLDRTPPFQVLSYTTEPAKAGGTVLLYADVWRDTTRNCSLEFSSYIYDSIGTRWDYEGVQLVTAEGMTALEAKTPGKLFRKMRIPENMAAGPASIQTYMSYRCNPLQDLVRPIQVSTEFLFEVLPPISK